MSVNELRAKIKASREAAKAKRANPKAGPVLFSENSPVGFDMIDAIANELEEQQRQIDELKRTAK